MYQYCLSRRSGISARPARRVRQANQSINPHLSHVCARPGSKDGRVVHRRETVCNRMWHAQRPDTRGPRMQVMSQGDSQGAGKCCAPPATVIRAAPARVRGVVAGRRRGWACGALLAANKRARFTDDQLPFGEFPAAPSSPNGRPRCSPRTARRVFARPR